jgi:D-xylose 1-dehydrogenase (NADP+, D-xylono-1,5-lactone-forming)
VVTWGLLSTARINDAILEGARLSEQAHVAAVASRDQGRAYSYARDHGIERAYGSYEALLADPEIEAVYVSLPNSMHIDWSIRALDAGKHVLCEKPLDRRPERVEEAYDVAERADRFLMEGFLYRHHPQTARLAELLEDGAIGALRLIRIAFTFPLTELGDVRMRPELDGGALMDVGCYCVSMARLLAGEPESATAQALIGSTGVDVRFVATLHFPDGVLAHFDCGMDLPYRSELEVVGSSGVLYVPDPFLVAKPGLELRREGNAERIEVEQVNRPQLELENLGDAIRGRADPVLGREDAVGQVRALELLHRAADRS